MTSCCLSWAPLVEGFRFVLRLAEYGRLLEAILTTFQRNVADQIILVLVGDFDPAALFEPKGRFDIILTYNTWISRMLRKAGVSFGIWTPTPYAVGLSLKWHT